MRFNKPLLTVAAIAALSLFSAGAAFAAGEFLDLPEQPFTSHTSRAAVKAEVLAARAAGQLAQGGEFLPEAPAAARTSVLTRAAVRADVLAAREAGTLPSAGEFLQPEQRVRAARTTTTSIVAQHGGPVQR